METRGTPRTLADLGELSEAERQVLAELDTGEDIVVGDGSRPEGPYETRRVRAALIRMLLVPREGDGLPRLHEKGVRIAGAWIPDALDLEGCRIGFALALFECRFDAAPVLRSTTIEGVFLNGSSLPGLKGDRLEVKGSVHLQNVEASGQVRLLGVKIGGVLFCEGARFASKKSAIGNPEFVFAADRLQVAGGVLLNGILAQGEFRMTNARVGADISCRGGVFLGLGDGATAGTLATALELSGTRVDGQLQLSGNTQITGAFAVVGAKFGAICDDREAWPPPGGLLLDRCCYGGFVGGAPVDAAARLDWLGRMDPTRYGQDFWPQPYEQVAKVLREMGHGEDARMVLIEKERRQRKARRGRAGNRAFAALLWVRDMLLGAFVGYGRRPMQAFWWLAGLWLLGAAVFWSAFQHGAMRPVSAEAASSAGWTACAGKPGAGACFLATPNGRWHPAFVPLVYSAETLLPVVTLDQRAHWAPDPVPAYGRGWWTRGYLWVHTLAGWALGLLAIAGFSGLVKSD